MEIAAITAFLAPFLKDLVGGVAEDLREGVASDAWGHAKRLWSKLRPRVETKESAKEAAADVAAKPDDERARAALELQLEKLLTADTELAGEVAKLWEQAKAAGVVAAGERSVAIGGDVAGSNIVTGDQSSAG